MVQLADLLMSDSDRFASFSGTWRADFMNIQNLTSFDQHFSDRRALAKHIQEAGTGKFAVTQLKFGQIGQNIWWNIFSSECMNLDRSITPL